MLFASDRWFQLRDYNISHQQMLVRSPAAADGANDNIDIIFWGVVYLEAATSLKGLMLTAASSDQVASVERSLLQAGEQSTVYCMVSGRSRFLVASAGFKVLRNRLDIMDSNLEYFAGTDSKRDLGEVLAHS